jgi:Protein of unknown function (DUF3551)
MRFLLATSAVLLGFVAFGSTPGSAREYAWCARTDVSGFNPSCSFTSFNQCMATVSGQAGDCIANPSLAYDQYNGPVPKRHGRKWNDRRGDDRGW